MKFFERLKQKLRGELHTQQQSVDLGGGLSATVELSYTTPRYKRDPFGRDGIASPGYSSCGRCHTSWDKVKDHATQYGQEGRGCFPLCQQCWIELGTPEARMPFYRAMYENWRWLDERYETDCCRDWAEIETAVLAGG